MTSSPCVRLQLSRSLRGRVSLKERAALAAGRRSPAVQRLPRKHGGRGRGDRMVPGILGAAALRPGFQVPATGAGGGAAHSAPWCRCSSTHRGWSWRRRPRSRVPRRCGGGQARLHRCLCPQRPTGGHRGTRPADAALGRPTAGFSASKFLPGLGDFAWVSLSFTQVQASQAAERPPGRAGQRLLGSESPKGPEGRAGCPALTSDRSGLAR